MTVELPDFEGFDWDTGNQDKNLLKHKVEMLEAEEIFFNVPLVLLDDLKHSQTEFRVAAFGKTKKGRHLVVIFTFRGKLIRVISARDMNFKERAFYEKFKAQVA